MATEDQTPRKSSQYGWERDLHPLRCRSVEMGKDEGNDKLRHKSFVESKSGDSHACSSRRNDLEQ